jgi:hypothetical protein
MIFRLSQKLAKKIKTVPTRVEPPDANPFADWSAHLFLAERAQYILLTNTASFYSTVMHGRGVPDDNEFLKQGLDRIREFMIDDGLEFIFTRFIPPTIGMITFSKALNRSVTASMNDLVFRAKAWLADCKLSPHEVSFRLNELPLSTLGYANPRERFKSLTANPRNNSTVLRP